MDEPVRGAASATRLTRVRKARTPRWRTVLKSRVKAKYAHRWTSPAAARRRARRWTALAGALVGSPFVALAVTAVGLFPAGAAIAPAMTAGPAGLLLLTEVNRERSPQRRSGTLLTSRTLTGERTVGLSRIERVRLLTYFSRSRVSQRVLLVRDTCGASLGLTSPASRRALRHLAQQQDGAAPGMRLGVEEGRRLTALGCP